jgi:peptide/nickel transport system ATP-binding protein
VSCLLQIRDLSVNYARRRSRGGEVSALRSVNFDISAGEAWGLAGESGSGKSTLARCLVGLVRPSAGQVRLDGDDIAMLRGSARLEARRRIQIVFQDPAAALSPRRSVAQSLHEVLAQFRGAQASDHAAMATTALAEVGLGPDVLPRYPHQFSSGQRQRIVLARALLARPDLLVADEAVSSLDVSVQAQVLQLLRRLRAEHGLALLFISHDLAVIRQVADQVAIMKSGQLVERGPVDAVYSKPEHPHTRELLAAHRLESGDDSEGLR